MIEIHTATEGRIDEIAALLQVAYAEFAPDPGDTERPAWDEYYNQEIPDVRSRWPFSEHLIAVEDDRILGAVTYIPDASDPRMNEDRWPAGFAAMRLLAVHPGARGRGLGRTLTEGCLERGRAAGRDWFGLHTTRLMNVARQMYERMGFERFPENDIPITPTFTVVAYRLKLP
ncbi:MAG TPA: GNAT family N-acetyltransferase [Actinomycetota bacterium]